MQQTLDVDGEWEWTPSVPKPGPVTRCRARRRNQPIHVVFTGQTPVLKPRERSSDRCTSCHCKRRLKRGSELSLPIDATFDGPGSLPKVGKLEFDEEKLQRESIRCVRNRMVQQELKHEVSVEEVALPQIKHEPEEDPCPVEIKKEPESPPRPAGPIGRTRRRRVRASLK